jgi:feruloyl esterase
MRDGGPWQGDEQMRRFSVEALVLLLFTAGAASPAVAATCESLSTLTLPGTEITGATVVPAGAFVPPDATPGDAPATGPFGMAPEFCRVTATLRPSSDSDIKIEVWLPAAGWNQRFQAVGNGGWAGVIPYTSLARAVRGGYASAATDGGHSGNTAAFAPGHPEKVIDMGYRAVHEMTVQGKAIAAAYYGDVPTFSIWNGCSTGGRQGVTAAVRYPADFDAVIAGAPAVNWMRLHSGRMALHQSVTSSPSLVIPPEKHRLLYAAVMAASDGGDGVADGVIEDPRACRVDPEVLACQGPDAPGCLTFSQVESARRFYAPVTHPATGEVIMPGLERGTEASWGTLGGPQPNGNVLEAFLHVVHRDAKWDWRRFNAALDIDLADRADDGALASNDPNLKPFFDRGGKLLMYHGWSDPLIPPRNTIDFFQRVIDVAGRDAVGRSVQLYMVPGMNHCGGGSGADAFDTLGALNEWTATGQAPSRITAARIVNGIVEWTRPLCPFGQVAQWNGAGSTNDAAAFACVADGSQFPDSR